MKDENYVGVILEEVRDQYKKITEGLDAIKGLPRQVAELKEGVDELRSDMQVVKAVVKEHSRELKGVSKQLNNHEERISVLEHA